MNQTIFFLICGAGLIIIISLGIYLYERECKRAGKKPFWEFSLIEEDDEDKK